jgi:hypothetical protein
MHERRRSDVKINRMGCGEVMWEREGCGEELE